MGFNVAPVKTENTSGIVRVTSDSEGKILIFSDLEAMESYREYVGLSDYGQANSQEWKRRPDGVFERVPVTLVWGRPLNPNRPD